MLKFHSALLLVASISGSLLADDESNFDAAPDVSWTRFDPTGLASFDFNNHTAQLSCALLPYEQAAANWPATAPRAALFAPTEFTDTCVSVDLLAWKPTTNRSADGQYHALFSRIQPGIGLGAVSGYGMAVIDLGNGNAELEIDRLSNEALIELAIITFPFSQNTSYRLVFSSRGDVHTARVFDLASPAAPVAELQVLDGTFPNGRTGFGVLTDRYAPPDATFDNFLTWDGSPCPVAIEPGDTPGTLVLTSHLHRSMGSMLETATDLAEPWEPAFPVSSEAVGGQLRLVFDIDQPQRFFRRKGL